MPSVNHRANWAHLAALSLATSFGGTLAQVRAQVASPEGVSAGSSDALKSSISEKTKALNLLLGAQEQTIKTLNQKTTEFIRLRAELESEVTRVDGDPVELQRLLDSAYTALDREFDLARAGVRTLRRAGTNYVAVKESLTDPQSGHLGGARVVAKAGDSIRRDADQKVANANASADNARADVIQTKEATNQELKPLEERVTASNTARQKHLQELDRLEKQLQQVRDEYTNEVESARQKLQEALTKNPELSPAEGYVRLGVEIRIADKYYARIKDLEERIALEAERLLQAAEEAAPLEKELAEKKGEAAQKVARSEVVAAEAERNAREEAVKQRARKHRAQEEEASVTVTLSRRLAEAISAPAEELLDSNSELKAQYGRRVRGLYQIVANWSAGEMTLPEARENITELGLEHPKVERVHEILSVIGDLERRLSGLDPDYSTKQESLSHLEGEIERLGREVLQRGHQINLHRAELRALDAEMAEKLEQERAELVRRLETLEASLEIADKAVAVIEIARILDYFKTFPKLARVAKIIGEANDILSDLAAADVVDAIGDFEEARSEGNPESPSFLDKIHGLLDAEKAVENADATIGALPVGVVNLSDPRFKITAEELASQPAVAMNKLIGLQTALQDNVSGLRTLRPQLVTIERRASLMARLFTKVSEAIIDAIENGAGALKLVYPIDLEAWNQMQVGQACRKLAATTREKVRMLDQALAIEEERLGNLRANLEGLFGAPVDPQGR